MSLYDDIYEAVAETIDEYGQDYIYLEEAVADTVFKRISGTVGQTQEKLLEQLEQTRAMLKATERRADALEDELATQYYGKVSQ